MERRLDLNRNLTDDELKREICLLLMEEGKDRYLSWKEIRRLEARIFNGIRGLDILQELLEDPQITEIMVNGPERIFVERMGRMEPVDLRFSSEEKLLDLIIRIAGSVNRVVTEQNPVVDARLPDGSRVHGVLKPVALNGPILTVRKFAASPITMDQLIRWGSITEEAAWCLECLVKAKMNIFISGATGSGKTTFLNVLSQYIPRDERVITIEDSAELQIRTVPNLVSLEARNANLAGDNQIAIRDLIKAALRMRPNRIIVGEVRGGEALDMLQAMNTGHDGSISTGHGNSGKDMLGRLETMVLMGAELPLSAIKSQIASALEILIHLGMGKNGKRQVMTIEEVEGLENGEIKIHPIFSRDRAGEGELVRTEERFVREEKLIRAGCAGL